MTKKSFLALVSALALLLILTGCGNNKNKEETEKPDNGDTEAVSDTDQIDAGDIETAPDEDSTDAETENDEMFPDIDWDEIPDDCTVTESYGEYSLTRNDITDVSEICSEKIAGAECYRKATSDNVEHLVGKLHKYEFVFNRENCRDFNEKDEFGNNKLIPCPDFIPEKFKLLQLTGCSIYIGVFEEYFSCITPCPDIYFLTDNDYFEKVVYSNYYELPDDKMKLHSLSTDGKVSFSSVYYDYDNSRSTTFSWYETSENGREIKKKIMVKLEIAVRGTVEEEVPDEDADVEVNDENADVEMNDEDAE